MKKVIVPEPGKTYQPGTRLRLTVGQTAAHKHNLGFVAGDVYETLSTVKFDPDPVVTADHENKG